MPCGLSYEFGFAKRYETRRGRVVMSLLRKRLAWQSQS